MISAPTNSPCTNPRTTRWTRPTPSTVLSVMAAVTALLASALIAACTPEAAGKPSGLHVQNAYLKLPVPGRQMTAAYLTLINHESQPLCLVGFEADFAGQVELHITEPVGGPDSQRVAMRHLSELCIEPGARATLKPGGMHLMVMNLNEIPAEHAVIRMGTSTGRLFSTRFRIRPFSYVPATDTPQPD